MRNLLSFLTLIFLAVPAYAETIIEEAQEVEEELDSINDEGSRLIKQFDEEVLPMLDKRQAEIDREREQWLKERENE